METSEISVHQIAVYDFVKSAGRWVSMKDIISGTGVKRETVGNHCRRFVKLGIFDQAEVWPGHRFRFAELAEKRNPAIIARVFAARNALNMPG